MSCQRLFWFQVPLTKQLKRDEGGHEEATINREATLREVYKQDSLKQDSLK